MAALTIQGDMAGATTGVAVACVVSATQDRMAVRHPS